MKRLFEYILEADLFDSGSSDDSSKETDKKSDKEEKSDDESKDKKSDKEEKSDEEKSDDKKDDESKNSEDTQPEQTYDLPSEDIKFSIWEQPDKKVVALLDNESYQKIEYKYINQEKKVQIDYLLGFDKKENDWKLWVGKIGSTTYDDDPLCSLGTDVFEDAILNSIEKIQQYTLDVLDDPKNWVQYYIKL